MKWDYYLKCVGNPNEEPEDAYMFHYQVEAYEERKFEAKCITIVTHGADHVSLGEYPNLAEAQARCENDLASKLANLPKPNQ